MEVRRLLQAVGLVGALAALTIAGSPVPGAAAGATNPASASARGIDTPSSALPSAAPPVNPSAESVAPEAPSRHRATHAIPIKSGSPPAQPRKPLSLVAGGTWNWQNPLPDGRYLFGVSCPSSTNCFAVGDLGQILASTDGGSHWTAQASGTTHDLISISCSTTSLCFAVGSGGLILATSNGGASWSPRVSNTTKDLYSIACPYLSYCYAVGAFGTIARTQDGTTWTASQPWGPAFLSGIDCPASSNCLAVGQGGINVWSNDYGVSWYTQASGTTHDLYTISCGGTCIEVGAGGTIVSSQPGYSGTVESSGTIKDLYAVACARVAKACSIGGVEGTLLSSNDQVTWAAETSGTQRDLIALSCATFQKCVAVGEARTILTINRSIWTSQTSATGLTLNGVSCPSTSVCFAVGESGAIVATSNGGAVWSSQSSGIHPQLNAVSCPTTTRCFAVGSGGTIKATVDGSTWTDQTSNTTNNLFGISCPSTTLCYAVGAFETIDTTVDGGTTWTAVSPGNDLQPIRSVSCPSTTTCLAIGESGGAPELVWVTTNGGTSWAHHDLSGVPILLTLSCPSVLICETAGQQPTHIYGSIDGGTNFSQQSAPFDPLAIISLNGSSCPSAAICAMVGSQGIVVVTTNGGTLWQSRPVDDTVSDLHSVSCPSTSQCFAVGDAGAVVHTGDIASPPPGWVLRSPTGNTNPLLGISCPSPTACYAVGFPGTFLASNDGVAWVDHSLVTTDELYAISCPSVTTCYAVGWPAAIYLTTNSGVTWSPQSNPVSGTQVSLNAVSCPGPTSCVAVGSGGTVLTTSNGTTWTARVSGVSRSINAVSCASLATCVATGDYGVALRSSNGGTSWSKVITNHGNFLAGLSCPSATKCYTVGYGGSMWVSTNVGATWLAQTTGVTANLFAVSCVRTTVCLAAGDFGRLVITVDGAHWAVLNPPTTNALRAVTFPDVQHAWVAGFGGAILANSNLTPECSTVSVAPDKFSPQPIGATILLTASSTGCSSPQYAFWLRYPSGTWVVKRVLGPGSTWSWITTGYPAGAYLIHVWANQAGDPATTFEAIAELSYTLTIAPRCATASLSATNPSQPAGSPIALTADSTVCPNPQYEFWIGYPNGTWVMTRGWGGPSFSWSTTGLAPGTYGVHVWANQIGHSIASYEAFGATTVTLTGCTSASIAPLTVTQQVGTIVRLTATADGGCPNPQYEFWIGYPNGTFVMKRTWGGAVFDWNTTGLTPGTYSVHVWANQIGAAIKTWEANGASAVTLTSGACTTASLNPQDQSVAAGTTVVLTANSTGCPNPQYEFWIQYPNGVWYLKGVWGGSTYNWITTGLAKGTYQVHVWARNIGDPTTTWEAYGSGTVTLT